MRQGQSTNHALRKQSDIVKTNYKCEDLMRQGQSTKCVDLHIMFTAFPINFS